jgi:hypothetical protein
VLTAACSQQGGVVYQAPIAEARQTLVATGLPPLVFGSEEPPWQVRDGGSEVAWIVSRNDVEIFRYVAHLEEAGPAATRVKVELKGAQSGPAGNVAQRLAEHPQIRDMYLVAINERIASALEHRRFEVTRVYPAMTAATMANIGALRASADEAAAASERQDRANIEKAYREEAAGRR